MGFPDGVLTSDEEVVLYLHPHWRVAIRPVIVLVVCLAAMIVAWVMLPTNTGGRIGVQVVAGVTGTVAVTRGIWPLLAWRNTHWVFTDERILLQMGVVSRDRRDLPLSRINDHGMRQGLVDRVFGSGTLTIDLLGDSGRLVLCPMPGVVHVQRILYELIEGERTGRVDSAEKAVDSGAGIEGRPALEGGRPALEGGRPALEGGRPSRTRPGR